MDFQRSAFEIRNVLKKKGEGNGRAAPRFKDRFGFSAANSQSLGETQYSGGRLRHDYEIGLLRLGKGGKPLSLRGSLGNVALLSGSKRGFSSEEPHGFKKLSVHKGKYNKYVRLGSFGLFACRKLK
jgi:hypothetical protein